MAVSLTNIATEGAKDNFLSKATHPRAFFTDLRREIISYITDFCLSDANFDKDLLEQEKLIKNLILCLEDYTRNHKGDIGSTVRISAMQNLQKLDKYYQYLPPTTLSLMIGKILQQGAEKILRIREEAANCLISLRDAPRDQKINSEVKKVLQIFWPGFEQKEFKSYKIKSTNSKIQTTKDEKWVADWGKELMFSKYAMVLRIKSIQHHVIRGLIVSSGDLTKSLSSKALSGLVDYLDQVEEEDLKKFSENLLECWKNDSKCQIAKPILKLLDEFLVREFFESIEEEKSIDDLFVLCEKYTKSKDAGNRINAISCISGFLKMDAFYARALKRFNFLLSHKQPFIRCQAAEKMLHAMEILAILKEIPDEVTVTLKDTDWMDDKISSKTLKATANKITETLLSGMVISRRFW